MDPTTINIIGILGTFIAIISFVISIVANDKINKRFNKISENFADVLKNFGDTKKNIEDLTESVQTKKILGFPQNIEEVIKLISKSERRVEIYSDVVCYGMFSNHDEFDKYFKAIEGYKIDSTHNKATRKLFIYTYNKALAKEACRKTFNARKYSVNNIAESAYAIHLKKSNPDEFDFFSKLRNLDELCEYFANKESEYKRSLNCINGNTPNYINDFIDFEIPFFLWIIDDKEAIIAFPANIGRPKEYSIKTSDKDLIETFKNFIQAKARINENTKTVSKITQNEVADLIENR